MTPRLSGIECLLANHDLELPPIRKEHWRVQARRLWQEVPLMDGWTDQAYTVGRVNISTSFRAVAGEIAANEVLVL